MAFPILIVLYHCELIVTLVHSVCILPMFNELSSGTFFAPSNVQTNVRNAFWKWNSVVLLFSRKMKINRTRKAAWRSVFQRRTREGPPIRTSRVVQLVAWKCPQVGQGRPLNDE